MLAPPKAPHDELEALIKEARERQLRRRLIGAAAVAIAAAVGLAVHALTIGGNPPATGIAQRQPASVPICQSGQLVGSAGFQGATETMLGGVTIRNTSNTTCSLPVVRPQLTLSWHGTRLRTQERTMTTGPSWPLAHLLAPGAKADVFFQWFSCGGSGPKAAVRPTFALSFGHRLVVTARSKDVTPAFCGGLGGTRFLGVSRALVNR